MARAAGEIVYVCDACRSEYQFFQAVCSWCDAPPNSLREVETEPHIDDSPKAAPLDIEPPTTTFTTPSDEFEKPRPRVMPQRKPRISNVQASDVDDGPTRLVDVRVVERRRRSSGIANLDRLLGGGMVESEGVVYSAWGNGGAGKSTLLTDLLLRDAHYNDLPVLYGAGEEPNQRVRLRAESSGIPVSSSFYIDESPDLARIERVARSMKIRAMVLDSLQFYSPKEHKTKDAVLRIIALAKELSAIFFIINQATKDGQFYGTNAIKHLFDGVLKFERQTIKPFRGDEILTPIVHVFHDGKHRLTSGTDSSPEGKPARFRWRSIDIDGMRGADRPGFLEPLPDDPKDDPDEASSTSIVPFGSV